MKHASFIKTGIILAMGFFGLNALMVSAVPLFTPDFEAKFTANADATYTTTLQNVSTVGGTNLSFDFTEISSGGYEGYSFSLPAGFSFVSYDTGSNTCASFNVSSASAGSANFSFSGTSSCTAKVVFTYQTTPSLVAGTHAIPLLYTTNNTSWSSVASLNIVAVTTNTITSATTLDTNHDGYIDAYDLHFSTG